MDRGGRKKGEQKQEADTKIYPPYRQGEGKCTNVGTRRGWTEAQVNEKRGETLELGK